MYKYTYKITETICYQMSFDVPKSLSEKDRRAAVAAEFESCMAITKARLQQERLGVEYVETVDPTWTADLMRRAESQGWEIRVAPGLSVGQVMIVTVDTDTFANDASAYHWVSYKAMQDSELHVKALAFVNFKNKA